MERRLATTLTRPDTELNTSVTPKAYDCQLDINSYAKISALESQIPPKEYAQKLLAWRQETIINLETNLGERFNAQLFEVLYPLKNGRMMHPREDQPFLDSLVDGQQHRLKKSSAFDHNRKRELAEVVSFSAVESNLHSGNLFLNPSPPGGNYGGNFIDIFDLQEIDGGHSIRMRRFAISANLQSHWQIAGKLTDNQTSPEADDQSKDIIIKKTVIKTSKTEEEILNLYLPDKAATSLEDYEALKAKMANPHKDYIDAVMHGSPLTELENLHNGQLKYADILMGMDTDATGYITPSSVPKPDEIPLIIVSLGRQNLRPVTTPCGIQGSAASTNLWDLTSSSLFRLNSFDTQLGEDQYGTLEIHCEECGATYNRTPSKLEEKCRRCGGTKGIVC